jgi:hypothetical protein
VTYIDREHLLIRDEGDNHTPLWRDDADEFSFTRRRDYRDDVTAGHLYRPKTSDEIFPIVGKHILGASIGSWAVWIVKFFRR